MRTSQLATLVAAAAISLPLLAYTASAVDASPHTAPAVGKQLAELRGSGTVAGDSVGFATAISGTTAIVGAYEHAKGAGVAYIFKMTGSTWNQVAELQGSDTVAGDEFGSAVAISDTTAVVGAGDHAGHAGRAYVFTKTAAGWKQVAELKGGDTVAGDYFGWSVSPRARLSQWVPMATPRVPVGCTCSASQLVGSRSRAEVRGHLSR